MFTWILNKNLKPDLINQIIKIGWPIGKNEKSGFDKRNRDKVYCIRTKGAYYRDSVTIRIKKDIKKWAIKWRVKFEYHRKFLCEIILIQK